MIGKIKKLFYFPVASYFRFFAQIRLSRWKPKIIVITGSSGKTTLLHLIESQIGEKAKYSHQANSSFGIPFDILGMQRKNLTLSEWPILLLSAPFTAFKTPPKENLYVVEADVDRPNEGKFLADLLKPEVTLWTGVGRTHTANFDKLVNQNHRHSDLSRISLQHEENDRDSGVAPRLSRSARRRTRASPSVPRMTTSQFPSVEDAIAYEFGFYLEEASKLAILNGDFNLIAKQIKRSKAEIKTVSKNNIDRYKVFKDHTEFKINGKTYSINYLLPKEASLSIQMTILLLEYFKIKPDYSFSKFTLPPGRCTIFKGIKNTNIIDSSYNATPDGMESILGMFELYPSDKKWLVLGDMIELGDEEQEEHEELATLINSMKLDKIILVGPRVSKYIYPRVNEAKKFTMPKDALDYLSNNLKGREVVLFKGARFLEGVIEHLLAEKKDIDKLPRREKVWQERRKKWGL